MWFTYLWINNLQIKSKLLIIEFRTVTHDILVCSNLTIIISQYEIYHYIKGCLRCHKTRRQQEVIGPLCQVWRRSLGSLWWFEQPRCTHWCWSAGDGGPGCIAASVPCQRCSDAGRQTQSRGRQRRLDTPSPGDAEGRKIKHIRVTRVNLINWINF